MRFGRFGDASLGSVRTVGSVAGTQRDDLVELMKLVRADLSHPAVVRSARTLIGECASNADDCEARAIYDAVAYGSPLVPAFERGLGYVNDPSDGIDFYVKPSALIREMELAASRGVQFKSDCDEHSSLIAALLGAIGFTVGLRAWGHNSDPKGTYEHVYAVVALPKTGPWPDDYSGEGLDTTEPDKGFGWEPPRSRNVLTAWLAGDGEVHVR